jgi:hypothetical protein
MAAEMAQKGLKITAPEVTAEKHCDNGLTNLIARDRYFSVKHTIPPITMEIRKT